MQKRIQGKAKKLGMTLVEMLVVVAIIGILATAFVSMGSLVRDFRVGYLQKRLYNTLLFARSEAVKRSHTVSVCRSVNGDRCDSGSNWRKGWIVFYDKNANRQVNTDDDILRIYNGISSDFKVSWTGSNQGFFFDNRGQVNFSSRKRFRICLDNVSDGPRKTINVFGKQQGSGRISTEADNGNC